MTTRGVLVSRAVLSFSLLATSLGGAALLLFRRELSLSLPGVRSTNTRRGLLPQLMRIKTDWLGAIGSALGSTGSALGSAASSLYNGAKTVSSVVGAGAKGVVSGVGTGVKAVGSLLASETAKDMASAAISTVGGGLGVGAAAAKAAAGVVAEVAGSKAKEQVEEEVRTSNKKYWI